jgi:hypothetical protein
VQPRAKAFEEGQLGPIAQRPAGRIGAQPHSKPTTAQEAPTNSTDGCRSSPRSNR